MVGGGRAARWTLTIGATVLSMWVLDLVATGTGVLVAWTGLLAGRSSATLVALLVVSYALWGVGLAGNLRANERLLAATGTSTNAVSKLGFDVVRARGGSVRRAGAVAAAGYVLTEVAKEAPYYLAAFGAAAVSDDVDGGDALVFLVGANLGAALYECCVARLTGAFLAARTRRVAVHAPGRAAATSDTVSLATGPGSFNR
jgi:hypothetical protein